MRVTRKEYKQIKALFKTHTGVTYQEIRKIQEQKGMKVRSLSTLWAINRASSFPAYKQIMAGFR